MLPANREPSQNNSVGFPLHAETRRLSHSLRNFNAVVVVILLSVAVWYCNQIHIWELGKGTIWAFFFASILGHHPNSFCGVAGCGMERADALSARQSAEEKTDRRKS